MTNRFARTAERVAARQDLRAAQLAEEVRDFVRPTGDERALDVGTGAGALAIALGPFVREVVGLDPVPELLELAAYLDLAGCEGGRRAQAEALAATNASLLVASVGWYLLVRSWN